jgi:hypothetical protein
MSPPPQLPGGMGPQLAPQYQQHIEELQQSATLRSLLEQLVYLLDLLTDRERLLQRIANTSS